MAIRELSPRIWMKLAAIALSFTIPLLLTTWFLLDEVDFRINFAKQELRGDQYLRPATRLLVHLEQHRSASRRQDSSQIPRLEALVDGDLRELTAVDRVLQEALETTSAGLSARGRSGSAPPRLAASWESVKLAADVDASEQLHQRLMVDVRQLITGVGDTSKLILDPDLDTYYVMDALLLQEPAMVDILSRLAAQVDTASASRPVDAAQLAGDVALLRFRADSLKSDVETAVAETKRFNHNDELDETLVPLVTRVVEATSVLAERTTPGVDRNVHAAATRDALEANASLWSALFDQEDTMLLSRLDGQEARRRFEFTAVGIALVLALALTFWVAWRISRNVTAVAAAAAALAAGDLNSRADVASRDEVGQMATAFNTMADSLAGLVAQMVSASFEVSDSATRLNSAADELAATTTEQSAAVTEASATTEELARASAAIAETVEGVAAQAAETRGNLQQAEGDMERSSERTMALAARIGEIGAILALINEIADQTNLLALNAAIEAARAGEGGKGFAVVAEEVRRLAERSKTSAADISSIIEGIQTETNATVMAMEKGAKQMSTGLGLLTEVADGTEVVRLTTQQQRSATSQVVETMEQLSDASRQVSETAAQIAAASGALAELAANLEATAAATAPAG